MRLPEKFPTNRLLAPRLAFPGMATLSESARAQILSRLADLIDHHRNDLLQANQLDVKSATSLPPATLDRLTLNETRIGDMISAVKLIASQPPVVHQVTSEWIRPDGLKVQRQRVPLGVIGMIVESRPNVTIDCAALAIKSGNCAIIKGGKEAFHTNEFLAGLIARALSPDLSGDAILVLDSRDRKTPLAMIQSTKFIDVVIPRGGPSLIDFIFHHARVPVIAHYKGVCHTYIHHTANLPKAVRIAINGKTQRPSTCNATETVLVDKKMADQAVPWLLAGFAKTQTLIKGCPVTLQIAKGLTLESLQVVPATQQDYATEYLANIVNIRIVEDLAGAIEHIRAYGTNHTEAILSESPDVADMFTRQIDASCIVINGSTRLNDGGQLGIGAEIGIATSKLHAYGPMGAAELTTSRFVVIGNGHCR